MPALQKRKKEQDIQNVEDMKAKKQQPTADMRQKDISKAKKVTAVEISKLAKDKQVSGKI